MAQNYTRQSSMADGDTITAALFNNEYNQLVNAFAYSSSSASSTGHRHDGTAGQGGNVPQIGDLDFLNKVVVDGTNNRVGFFVEVSSSAVEQIRVQDGAVVPVTDNDIDLGTSSLEFKDGYFDGTLYADAINFNGTAITATAAELNIMDGVTSTAAEINLLDGVTATTTELNYNDTGSAVGTVVASKVVTVDANKDVSSFRNVTLTGELDAATGDFSGNVDIDGDLLVGDDLTLDSDAAVLGFGADTDVTLTHVADTGLLLNSTMALQFNDASQYINAPSATVLDINATDEIELNATAIDINGAVDISGNLDVGGNLVVTGTTTFNGGTLTLGDADSDNVVFGANVDSNIIPDDDDTYDLGSSSQQWKDLYVDGVAYVDAINFNGTAISATAAELNIMDGVTATAAELNYSDTGSSVGTVVASKVVTVDANKDVASFRNITLTGELDAGSLDISGDADIDGTLETDALSINGTAVTATAAELNILDGVTSTAAELNILDGVTSTTAELNILDGVTSTAAELNILDGVTSTAAELNILDGVTSTTAELNTLDGITAVVGELNALDLGSTAVGTAIASKAVVLDSDKDYTGIRNLSITGNLSVGGTTTVVDTVTMNAQNAVLFEGATADAYETTLTIVDPTADRTINLPNQSGTLPVLAAVSTTAITSTPEELNVLDGITAVVGELNALDLGSTAVGTAIASKAVILDSNKDYTGIRNFTITGELDAGSLDISGDIDVDGTANLDNVDIDGTFAAITGSFVKASSGGTATAGSVLIIEDDDNTELSLLGGGSSLLAINFGHSGDVDDGMITYNTTSGSEAMNFTVDGGVDALYLSADDVVFNNGGVDMNFRVESNNNANMLNVDGGNDVVLIGGGTTQSFFGESHELQVNDTNFSVASFATYRNGSDGATLSLGHSRNGTISSHTIVNDGDTLGRLVFFGSDGTDFASGASITAAVDGTPGNNDMPGRLVFATTADGADIPTERMIINQKGSVGIGVADGDVTSDGTAARTYVGIIGTANRGRLNIGTTASNGADAGTLAFTNGTNSLVEFVVDTHSGVQNAGDLTIDATGDIILDADGAEIIFKDGGTQIGRIRNVSSDLTFQSDVSDKDIVFNGNDGGSTVTALTLDMSSAGAATFNNNVTAYSDERLKSNIETIENGLEKVEKLRGVTYTRDERDNIGVIAQEVEKVLPDIVLTADDMMGTKSVDYGRITAVLIEAVKELSARVKELENN